MRTVIALGIAALLTLAGVMTWVTAAARSNNSNNIEKNALARSDNPIVPFELMKSSKGLPHEQWDAF